MAAALPPPAFHLPADARVETAAMADGTVVRRMALDRRPAFANALVLNGRADFLEKWADAYVAIAGQQLGIAGWDWRGQGLSTRSVSTGAGHIDRFDRWLGDLDELGDWALGALPPRPWIAVAHSMGAHLLLRWLSDPAYAGHRLRKRLCGVVLVAPFFGLGMAWPLRLAVLAAARRAVARGHGERFAPGQGPYSDRAIAEARMLLLTGSMARFEDEARWVAANPALACGGVTWGFLHAFAQSQRALEAGTLDALDLPVMILLAGRERLVDNRAATRIAARLPRVELSVLAGSAHEILRETDRPRCDALAQIRGFAERVTKGKAMP